MLIIYTTFSNKKDAQRIAEKMVRERLAACASIFPCKSIFFWKGKLQKENEVVIELKIAGRNYKKLEQRLLELHPYSLPQIVAVKVEKASEGYARWVEKGEA